MNLFSKDKIKKIFSKLKPSRKFLILTVLILISFGGLGVEVSNAEGESIIPKAWEFIPGIGSFLYFARQAGFSPGDALASAGAELALIIPKYLVSFVILPLSSAVLSISGWLFNISFKETVLKMGENLGGGAFYQTINSSWGIFRDVSNILIVFILIYISIKIILGLGGQAKKMIPAVILVSILINFSLFFAQLPIDLSNVLAIKIHESAGFKESSGGISEAFLAKLGLNSTFALIDKEEGISSAKIIIYGLISSVFILILALILFIAAFFFIARYIILIIVLITSAAAVGSLILPQLKSQIWSKWVDNLVGQSVFAPIFIFMLALSLKILSSFSEGQGQDWVAILQRKDYEGFSSILLVFFLTIGFLIASLVVAKTFANKGGGYAGKMTTFMGGAAVGGTAILGRRVGGNLVGGVLSSRIAKNLASSEKKGFMGTLARTTGALSLKAGEKAKGSTWDFRNTSSVSKLLKTTGTDLGSGSKDTVKSIKEDQKKKYEAAAKRREYTEEQKEAENNRRKALDAKRKPDDLVKERIAANTDFYNSNSEEDVATRQNLQEANDAKNTADSNIISARGNLAAEKAKKKNIEDTLAIARRTGNKTGQEMVELGRQLQDADEEIGRSEKALVSAENQVSEAEKKLAEAEKLKAAAIEKRINEMRGYVDMDKVKENYYRRKSEDISIGGLKIPLSRGLGRIGGTSNSTLMELYRKERKGETDMDKLMKKVMEEMKKNNSATPPTTPPTTTP